MSHPTVAAMADTVTAIGLDEVVATAELQSRIDRKYLVHPGVAPRVLAPLRDSLQALDIDGRRSFHYRSDYYDTVELDCFRHHLQGRRRRAKVRVRTYEDSGLRFLEAKVAGGSGETVKTRQPLDGPVGGVLRGTAREFARQAAPGLDGPLVRTAVTTYQRSTFVLDHESRVTVDTALVLAADGRLTAPRHPLAVVETKSATGAGPVDRALWRLGVRPVAVSKYCLAIALLRPGARSNPWHRVIRQHFPAGDEALRVGILGAT